MSNILQFLGAAGIKPTAINIGGLLQATTSLPATTNVPGPWAGGLVGAVTADTLKTILSHTGRGALTFLGVIPLDATSRTARIKITLDGTVVFDATSTAGTAVDVFQPVVGSILQGYNGKNMAVEGTPLLYEQSLLIEYASSLTETNKASVPYIYYTR